MPFPRLLILLLDLSHRSFCLSFSPLLTRDYSAATQSDGRPKYLICLVNVCLVILILVPGMPSLRLQRRRQMMKALHRQSMFDIWLLSSYVLMSPIFGRIVKACASKAAAANVHGPVHSPSMSADDPSGILNPGKTRKNIHTGFFEPYNCPKGWGQVSNKYIQHIYSYSTLSNYSKAQHGRGNEFANTIGTHQ